ncbi:SDR family oxidoreductase [Agromyces sp. H3Y2-19a]|jgi:NAD(P)-dependent dehydrogenase (short-subunit alcohol dehydrogenase family)|uniref:SDR family oxidoreductase n=1 Tax=Agromyces TaxID=33877 RepID=UPI001E4132EB|nr:MULTISPECIES: SDR family oxidoreductase [Agromyces]MCD5345073.1 SDR family oxidoreductase [Agromyces sp. S2-1-8]MDF0513769.1 SDR family oxidoreductase [Agromyces chromiiresistens]
MSDQLIDPTTKHTTDRFPRQEQEPPGLTGAMAPLPDHGEQSYRGSGRLEGRRALITGGDSGIGRAVAIAFAREGARVAIAYLPEEQADADETGVWISDAGSDPLLLPGDLRDEAYCVKLIEQVEQAFGGIDLLVLNAAHQRDRGGIEGVPSDDFEDVMRVNLFAPVYLARAAVPRMDPGSSIITTASIQASDPSPAIVDYAMTKAALVAFTYALAEELGPRGIRVNAVAPGPVWTPLIPATGWPDKLPGFGKNTPIGRAGQPAELAGAYVYLASDEASYTSGAIVPVTGGRPL